MLSQSRLKELLVYDQMTGEFSWKRKRGKAKNSAGGFNDSGYILIGVDGRSYRAHRLAWLYVYGEFPDNDIDHINGSKSDNRIDNLRCVNRSVNMQNLKASHKDNSTGMLGVTVSHNKSKPYRASLSINGVRVFSGYFETSMEAHSAYMKIKSGRITE